MKKKPSEEFEDEDYEYIDEEEEGEYDLRQRSPLVRVLVCIAAVCVVALGVLLALSRLPRGEDGQDPAGILHMLHVREEEELREDPVLDTTEETTEPTIPPELNPFNQYDFQYDRNNLLYCLRQESYAGVDVSAFQGDIDWHKVRAAGIDFAMLRLGYRGWGEKGTLVEDEYIQKNLAATYAAGMPIGAYFFSQATTLDEVLEEIEFMLSILGNYPLQYPIVLDWEIADPSGRNVNVTRRELTDMLRFFCDEMKLRGFDPMVYFNWTQSSRMLYLNELEDVPFWLALYQDRMTYPFRIDMWQYTNTGNIPGIAGDVDVNLYIPDLRER